MEDLVAHPAGDDETLDPDQNVHAVSLTWIRPLSRVQEV